MNSEATGQKKNSIGNIGKVNLKGIDWVIIGGESGPGARQMKEEWVLEIKRQCIKYNVLFFFKQWGGVRKKTTGRILFNKTWDEMPTSSLYRSGTDS